MSVIEQAAKRLEHLRSSAAKAGKRRIARENGVSSEILVCDLDPADSAANLSTEHSRARSFASHRVSIDLGRLNGLGLVSPDNPKSNVSEEFRVIKRPLIRNANAMSASPIENGNLIMITSAVPGEGKTSSAVSLAMSIAMELDKTVLLVDADVARPSILHTLGIEETRGLLDVLLDQTIDLSDVLLRTSIEKLVILPSGSPHPHATELLASESMASLVREMAGRYPDRIVIFDSPPLLLTNEATALAAHMGQIVVVVEAEKTEHEMLKQAMALIEACPVRLLLLNKSRCGARGGYYGKYGESGYGRSEAVG